MRSKRKGYRKGGGIPQRGQISCGSNYKILKCMGQIIILGGCCTMSCGSNYKIFKCEIY